jgi:hypothetical protein
MISDSPGLHRLSAARFAQQAYSAHGEGFYMHAKKVSKALVANWQKEARKRIERACSQAAKRGNWRERIQQTTGKDPLTFSVTMSRNNKHQQILES